MWVIEQHYLRVDFVYSFRDKQSNDGLSPILDNITIISYILFSSDPLFFLCDECIMIIKKNIKLRIMT